jgi:tripartite-type tricarboxylate transporter receptor subunit TctC
MVKYLAWLLSAAIVLIAPVRAQPQETDDYPNRAVKIIVSAPAGGGLDVAARIIGDRLRQHFGQPFIIENRAGASGNTGAEAVATAPPDGYTLLAAQPAPLTVNAVIYRKLHFDPSAFEPIAIMTAVPNFLVVRPNLPAQSPAEFIAYARAHPLNFASQGIGTTPHLTAELFNRVAGTRLVHVPYKGTAQAMNDVIGGHVDLMFLEMQSATQVYRAGLAKVLAVASERRAALLPDIPTFAEGGLVGVRSDTWNALAAPPKTPAAIVARLNGAINAVLRDPDVQAHFAAVSLQPVGGSPQEMGAFVKAETERWGEVIRAANIKAD